MTKVFIIWEQNYYDDGETYKSIFKATLDEDLAKNYCDTKNEEQFKLFGDSIYKTQYFYSAEELLTSYNPAL